MKREVTICKNCKHRFKYYNTCEDNNPRAYICKANKKILASPPIDFVTGLSTGPEFYMCTACNTEGDCKKFEPGVS